MMREAAAEAARRAETARMLSARKITLRGHNLAIQEMDDPEILLVGAAGTGKTLGVLYKLHTLAMRYAGARILIVRKVRADLAQSTLVTFERDILGVDNPICAGVQRESRQAYRYPNGSEIVVGGMDRPGKVLSADYDLIYPAEAVQFAVADWETFVMRLRTGVVPYQQLIADTNPDRPDHWLKLRADAGTVKLLNTTHKDNPAYWDDATGDWTARGRDYVLGKLERLTGLRRARYLENRWVTAEGVVYEDWNEAIHIIEPFPIPPHWARLRSIDFGYTNPFVCQWWAIDDDGRMYLYRELYRARRIVEDHAAQIAKLSEGERYIATVADHDAEDRATLARHGIVTVPADKRVSAGIQAVQARLRTAGDGKPRLYMMRGALVDVDESLDEAKRPTRTAQEIGGYVWERGADGKANKEQPTKYDDHGMDAMRYAVMHFTRRAKISATIWD